jgi:hypothetical protein
MSNGGYGYEIMDAEPVVGEDEGQGLVRGERRGVSPIQQMINPNDMLKVIQEYLKEEGMPSLARDKFWGLNTKFLSITFFDKKDVEDLRLMSANAELIEIMSKPVEDYDWEKMQFFKQQDIMVFAQGSRSVGAPQGRMNERTLQNTQIGQMIHTRGGGGVPQRGFKGAINKIFG